MLELSNHESYQSNIHLSVYYSPGVDKILIVAPWWECIEPEEYLSDLLTNEVVKTQKVKYGMLCQVGWLVQNEHGVYFGVALDALENFEYLGTL